MSGNSSRDNKPESPSPVRGRGVGERVQLLEYAKQLRSNQTEAEQRLWYYLRGKRFMGLKFKRQKPIGPYIVDFVCMEYKLVVEADGGQHGGRSDVKRDAWFAAQRFTLLRFWNNEILEQTDMVLEQIRRVIVALSALSGLSPDPSPARGRGE